MATARTVQIEKAIRHWGLLGRNGGASRWQPPESFLPEHAPIGRLTPVLPDQPDFVNEHAGFFLPKPAPVRLPPPTRQQIAQLAHIGTPSGPTVQAAVMLLRQVRGTADDLTAADAVRDAPGPVPEAVRLEAAFLFAVNGDHRRALEVLEGERRPPPSRPPRVDAPPACSRPFNLETADAIVQEAEVWGSFLALHHVQALPPPLTPAVPPTPRDVAPPAPTVAVNELDLWRLTRMGQALGPTVDEAVATLRATRHLKAGKRALENALEANRRERLPEPVLTLCAEILAERGEHDAAFALLATPEPPPLEPEPPGIDVDTPLDEGAAAARADEAERVLAHDTERLGVAERRSRFRAVARAGELTLDAIRALGGRKRDALRDAGRALEDAGEPGRAAEVYALGGDHPEAGRLGVPPAAPLSRAITSAAARTTIAALAALDRRGLRLAALAAARVSLAEQPDLEVAAFVRGVLARLVRGPLVTLAIDGRTQRIAFGSTVTIGRTGATLVLATPLVSRLHLRLHRLAGVAMVEDPGSHNGTWLAGARLTAPVPVGARVDLRIGHEIPCVLQDEAVAVAIDLAGERTLAPLGPLVVAGLRLEHGSRAGEDVVTLTPEPGVLATLEGAPLETAIELSLGDVVCVAGSSPRELRVIA
jgi:hypothetical protein